MPYPLVAGPTDLAVQIHVLGDPWAKAAGPSVSLDGTELVWGAITSLDDTGQPYLADIVSFTPTKDSQPHVIFHDPEADTRIFTAKVRAGHYAFLETNERLLGNGWRLWSLPGEGAEPVPLDSKDGPDGAPSPSFAVTSDGIVWTAVHLRKGVAIYELRFAHFDGSGNRAVLSAPVEKTQYWYPSVDPSGRSVLYGTVEPSGKTWRFRIYEVTLTDDGAKPAQLGTGSARKAAGNSNDPGHPWRATCS